jgi:hypothetical protein
MLLGATGPERIRKTMFGFSSKKLPLEEADRAWIESALLWLLSQFGTDFFLNQTLVLPEPRFFPDTYRATEECVCTLVTRVCGYMKVDPKCVEVAFFSDRDDTSRRHRLMGETNHRGAAGYFQGSTQENGLMRVSLNTAQFRNPTSLVATIAHELGHVILLGQGRISSSDASHEFMTDLLTVFFGLGVFTANSAIQFAQWQDHSHQGWRISRLGYLSEEMFAYALAAYAWMRGDSECKWKAHLAINVKAHFKTCLNYFEKSGATTLKPLR